MDPVDVLRRRITEKLAGRSPAVLAKGVGRSAPWISRFLQGQRDMPFDTAAKVATFFGVPLWQLLIDDEELRSRQERETNLPGFKELPWLAAPVGAGPLLIEGDKMRDEGLAFSERFAHEHPGAICLTVGRGQISMSPTIQPGDIVVIDTAAERRRRPRSGEIYAISFARLAGENRGAVKRVELRDGHLIISSDNPDKREFQTEVYDVEGVDLLDVLKGQVVWFGRNMGEKKRPRSAPDRP